MSQRHVKLENKIMAVELMRFNWRVVLFSLDAFYLQPFPNEIK